MMNLQYKDEIIGQSASAYIDDWSRAAGGTVAPTVRTPPAWLPGCCSLGTPMAAAPATTAGQGSGCSKLAVRCWPLGQSGTTSPGGRKVG